MHPIIGIHPQHGYKVQLSTIAKVYNRRHPQTTEFSDEQIKYYSPTHRNKIRTLTWDLPSHCPKQNLLYAKAPPKINCLDLRFQGPHKMEQISINQQEYKT